MPYKPGFAILTLNEGKKIFNLIKKKLPFPSYVAGSIRRENDYVNDIDIVIIPGNYKYKPLIESILATIKRNGDTLINGIYYYNDRKVLIDFFITTQESFPYAMMQYTGPKSYNIRIRRYVKQQHKWKLNQYGIFYLNKLEKVRGSNKIKTEKDINKFIGTTYYHPRDRK